ncbi:MAG TPA: HAMP domain-containing sensor histidine kinase [Anaeromyxobacteraceae bacterium]|nr:HAMP domain-containing sensor histidine kinase [Anaeromyxobacteraceae bacterium]
MTGTGRWPAWRRRRHPRLFWSVYLHGVLMLLAVGVALAVAGAALGRGEWRRGPERALRYAALRLGELRGDPARLDEELRRVREMFGVELALYRDDGTLLAGSAEPPPSLGAGERERLARGPERLPGPRFAWAARLPGEPAAYLVMAGGSRSPSLERIAAFLLAVLLALAVASVPLARAIARPLERLTAAARALGSGDLSARAGVDRADEVGELGQAFDEMAERLERLLRQEKELLANVSHELRTPLSRIRVALDLAAEGDPERARRFLGEIAQDLSEVERLVEDILTAARLDLAQGRSGAEVPLRREAFPAADLVSRAGERFRAAHPGRALEVTLGESLPELDADAALLRRALDNLLDNAAKYSEPSEPVALSAREEDGALLVEVRDRGIGIDPQDLSRLFIPFFRTDRSRARGSGGVGLGLALAKRIVEAHGGSIAVESAPGKGTAVRVRVPAASRPA